MGDKLKYVDIDVDFKPLPKYGHYSEKHPVWEAAEEAIRAGYAAFASLPLPEARVIAGDPEAPMPPGGPDRQRDVVTQRFPIKARDGRNVELKVYKSPNVRPNAILMYRMHGGGWCVGGHEVDGVENVYAATNPGIVVVSVDYRLAPENPLPGPLNDCYDGLLWCKNHASVLGVDPERIIISGSSAGGNLAAALALECREKGVTGVIAQVIHFPIICHPKYFPKDKHEFGSYIQNRNSGVLSSESMERVWDAYDPDTTIDQRHSPLLAASLKGLPPALMQIGGYDVLRDEGLAYAEELKAAGVETEMHCYSGLPHCFPVVLNAIPETKTFYERYMKFLEKYAPTTGEI